MAGRHSWYGHNGYSPFNESEDVTYADPMAEMMRAMSRQPEVGYDFITGEGAPTSTSTSATGATTGTTASRRSPTG